MPIAAIINVNVFLGNIPIVGELFGDKQDVRRQLFDAVTHHLDKVSTTGAAGHLDVIHPSVAFV